MEDKREKKNREKEYKIEITTESPVVSALEGGPESAGEPPFEELSELAGKPSGENLFLAVFFMVLSGLAFALMNMFSRMSTGIPVMQRIFFRNLITFLGSAIFIGLVRRGDRQPLIKNREEFIWLLVRSILGTIGIISHFAAVDMLPLAIASILNKLSPFFTIIFAAAFLKEPINRVQTAGLFIAFAGVLILLRPDLSGQMNWFPYLVAILGGISAGGAYTCIRHLARIGASAHMSVLFFAGFASLCLFPVVILDYYSMNFSEIIMVLAIGISGLVGQYGISFAYSFAAPNKVSIYDYSNIVFASVFGILFFDQIPQGWDVLGILIIFGASLLMYLYNRRREGVESKQVR